MHALVAFSGIKTARDFQTFSRDIAYTGANSIMNPAPPGLYSGWLKTRILIETHRIGRFYVGKNLDILPDSAAGREKLREVNPYSKTGEQVECVQLPRFGDPKNYVEPFAGSLAVLLARPTPAYPARAALRELASTRAARETGPNRPAHRHVSNTSCPTVMPYPEIISIAQISLSVRIIRRSTTPL
jgi:hypothetical protein